jgi:hypothetical protein
MSFTLEKQETTVESVVMKRTMATKADVTESYMGKEQVFEGYIGAVEVPISALSTHVLYGIYPRIDDADGNALPKPTYGELFPHRVSNDGLKALIPLAYCPTPHSYYSNVGISNDKFYVWADKFGIENIYTKSTGGALYASDNYRPIAEEV